MYKLHDIVTIAFGADKYTGRIIGIDTYQLENFVDKKISWKSYTLVSKNKGLFSRYWFVQWGNEYVLWLAAKPLKSSARFPLVMERSGVARIAFKGDAGLSTPIAALTVLDYKGGYYCAERFSGSETMFFAGHIIKKPVRSKSVAVKRKK